MAEAEAILRVAGLGARYGKVQALRDIALEIRSGEAVALLGANGSGKTTLLSTLSGFLPVSGGTITLEGARIDGLPPHRIFARGIVQVSQGRDLFGDMSVIDNLRLGAVSCKRGSRKPGSGPTLDEIFGYFPRLAERQGQRVKTLSGGEQQMVALGRALMSAPRLLLLDEPSAGLAPRFVEEIGRIMGLLKERGTTMLLVEQNLALAAVADRFYVLRAGTIVDRGDAETLRQDHRDFARTYYL